MKVHGAGRTMPGSMMAGLVVVLLSAMLSANPAHGYQLFSQNAGGAGVSPSRWQSLPVSVRVDNGPVNVLPEIVTAVTTWNDVATARAVWGTPTLATGAGGAAVDFTGANFGTAWGNLTGDGAHEVVFDEDGSALRALGLDPASVNGYGPSSERVVGGLATIYDMYLIVNGSRADFDRQATEIHELGHTLGLAHSSVGFYLDKPDALSPVSVNDVPTMHPYSVGGGMQRRTLEADDAAALSELYPEATFASSLGVLTGVVTRCGTNEPVLGANVRAINVSNPSIQLTRVTGYDGNSAGRYEIRGAPAGNYVVLVEPLSGNDDFSGRLAMYTRVDTDFSQEFHNASKEPNCDVDTDPDARENLAVTAGATQTADFKVDNVSLALVVDTTGSMSPEIGAVRAGLRTFIDVIDALRRLTGQPFPNTAVVTFKDTAQTDIVSRDPDALRTVVDSLTASGGGDCPEASNAALVVAGRLLAENGRAVLATDADSRPDGPSRATVESLYRSKGARLSTVLSGTCSGGFSKEVPSVTGSSSRNSPSGEVMPPIDRLGSESAIATFSELSLFTGGFFSFQPEVKSGAADAKTTFANTVANVAVSAVTPAVGLVSPNKVTQGSAVDVEITGSNTNFKAGSAVSVSGAGVSADSVRVLSPTRLLVRLVAAPDAVLGFRDVTVTTDKGGGSTEVARGIGSVEVRSAPTTPTILGVAPSTAGVGSTVDVNVSAAASHFASGVTAANFGSGVTVDAVTVTSPTSAVVKVTVAPDATIGFRSVVMTTGDETATENVPGPFLVVAGSPAVPVIASVSPTSAPRGSTVDVTVTGTDTSFAPGVSAASFSGAGISVLSTTVSGPTSAVARVAVAPGASPGFRDVVVTTGGEVATLLNGFEVIATPTSISGPYTPLTPARILDTRDGTGGLSGPVPAAQAVDVPVAGRGGVPATGVSAVAMNVTVTQPTADGYLTLFAGGTPQPPTANLNFTPGKTVPNLVVVPVGADGKVAMFNSAGTTHVIFDVTGWYSTVPIGNEGRFQPLVPARIADSRDGTGGAVRLGPGLILIGPSASFDLQVAGRGGVPATGAGAAVLNVAVTNTDAESYLTVFPTGEPRPLAANLNYLAGNTVSNRVIAKLGAGGKVTLFNNSGTTDIVVDVNGYFTDASVVGSSGALTTITPARVLDTRLGLGGIVGPIPGNSTSDVQVAGTGGVPPAGATAVVINATVVGPGGPGFLTMFPTGDTRPLASDLNFAAGEIRPNLVVVKLGVGGKVSLYTSTVGDVVLDVVGYFS